MSDNTKNIFITGASGGIGSAVALEFAEKFSGASLFLTAKKNSDKLNKISDVIQKDFDCHVKCFLCDLSDQYAVKELFSKIPSVDILIHTAGMEWYGQIQDMTANEWKTMLDTNLSSAFYCANACIPYMVKQKTGTMIYISSVWGSAGASMEAAYAAAKGGLNAFTKSLAKELAPSNINVNAIACGFIDTDMNARLSREEKENVIAQIPANRAGTPKEVAEFAAMLAMAPSYLTGQIIAIDGGWQ